MIPYEISGRPPPKPITQQPQLLTRTQLIEQGYQFEPSGIYTYGVPLETGIYVKYETTPPLPPTRLPGGIIHAEQSLEEQGGIDPWSRLEKQLPPGAKMLGYKEVPGGYEISYEMPQPSWKEGSSITAQLYSGQWKGLLGQFFPHMKDPFRVIERKGPASEFVAGEFGVFESWINPEVPTPSGALVGKVFGKTSAYETGEVSPFYLGGGLLGTVAESYIVGAGISKAWGGTKWLVKHIAPETAADIARWARFGTVPKLLHEAKETIKYSEPFYSFRKIPSNVSRYFAQKFPSEAVRFEAAMPWGEGKFFLPKSFEFWATWKEASKYVGYPVITSKLAEYGVVTVVKPTAFQQIQQAIAKGMYPRMGGLSAIQVPIFEKPSRQWGTELIYRGLELTGKKATSLTIPVPLLKPWTWERQKQTFQQLIVLPKEPMRKSVVTVPKIVKIQPQRLFPQTITIPKQRQGQALIPKIIPVIKPIPKQVQKQRQAQLTVTMALPGMPKIQIPKVTFPSLFPTGGGSGGGGRGGSLFGKWFRKQQLIKTPKQMLETYFGKPHKRRKK